MSYPLNPQPIDEISENSGYHVPIWIPKVEELPAISQGYSTNNQYDNFPPLMTDSRSLIAAWQPESVANDALLKASGVQSNWEYRQYLTRHAVDIMRNNFMESANDIGHYVNPNTLETIQYQPAYRFNGGNDDARPYGMAGDSDLKQMYLSREQLQQQRVVPTVSQPELFYMQSAGAPGDSPLGFLQ
jgi:hypothetical protein